MENGKITLLVEDLHFGYTNDVKVLRGMSFSVRQGELLFLLGPNGSGKTTLFKCLLGFYKPSKGRVLVDGEEIRAMPVRALARKVAYIPQAHSPGFNYTALEVVLMGRAPYLKGGGFPGREDRKIALEAMDRLGITYLRDKGYAHISGGERQMVIIARALAQQSKILIMDEPTSNLDYGHQVKVLSVVKKLAKEGYTIVISSHNPEHAFLYANQVLLMKEGELLVKGDPKTAATREILQTLYDVPLDVLNITRNMGIMEREYRICIPVFED